MRDATEDFNFLILPGLAFLIFADRCRFDRTLAGGPAQFCADAVGEVSGSGLVVASANDPYVTLDRLRAFAGSWDADFCYAGEDR